MKIALILVLSPLFLIGVFGDEVESVSVNEGDSVTLHTDFTEIQKDDDIEWMFKGTRIASISMSSELSVSISADGEFRDRLQLDNQTGDLKITDIKITDSGEYKLDIFSTRGSPKKTFIVNVVPADPVKTDQVSVMEGDSVTLKTAVNEILKYDVIRWRFGHQNSPIAEMNRKVGLLSLYVGPDERFRDRLQMDYLTGSLTIRNIGTEHSGLYEVDISNSKHTIHKSCIVTVRDGLKSLSVSEGESVTLNTDLTEIQTDDVILWMFRDTHIAEINKADQQFHTSDGPDGRFRGRLKVDQTGSLTIMNTRTTDSGLYEVTISGSRFTIHKRIIVTVTDVKSVSVKESDSVHLKTGVTEIQRDDQILWKFGDEVIPTDRLKDPKVGTTWSNTYLNEQTGDLNISNIRGDQFGYYKVEIITGSTILHKKFRIMIDSGSGLSAGTVVGIIVAALLGFGALAVAVIYYRRQIYKLQRQMQETVAVIQGESVFLIHDDGFNIQKGDIEWKYEDSSIAERRGSNGESTLHEDVLDKKFKGRLHLDKSNGSLKIEDARFTDSGRYELRIIRSGHESVQTFIVSVCDPKNPEEMLLKGLSAQYQ